MASSLAGNAVASYEISMAYERDRWGKKKNVVHNVVFGRGFQQWDRLLAAEQL